MNNVRFFSNVQFQEGRFENAIEDYFYLDGISNKVGFSRYEEKITEYKVLEKVQVEIQLDSKRPRWVKIALNIIKFISYLTLFIPALMLIGKVVYRKKRNFEVTAPASIKENIDILKTLKENRDKFDRGSTEYNEAHYKQVVIKKRVVIKQLNIERKQLRKERNSLEEGVGREELNTKIKELEKLALDKIYVKGFTDETIAEHKKLKKNDLDGTADWEDKTILETLKVSQKPGLHQVSSKNGLCGYYALHFLKQTILKNSLSDRNLFNKYFPKWLKTIWRKRAKAKIANAEDLQNTTLYKVSIAGLVFEELRMLISKDDDLKNVPNCFYVETSNLEKVKEGFNIDPVKQISEERSEDAPAHIIWNTLGHYYYVKVKRNGENFDLICTHSLGYDITNEKEFSGEEWQRLKNCINESIFAK